MKNRIKWILVGFLIATFLQWTIYGLVIDVGRTLERLKEWGVF